MATDGTTTTAVPTPTGEGATTRAAKKGAGAGALAGVGTGAALAQVTVWALDLAGVDAHPVEAALGTIFSGVLAVVASWYGAKWAGSATPTDRARVEVLDPAQPAPVPAPEAVAVPDGTGDHRAVEVPEPLQVLEPAGSTAVVADEVAPVVTETTVEVTA